MAFVAGTLLGFGIGFIAAVYGRLQLEAKYKQTGIAKIDGEYFKITKINKFD